MVHMPRQRVLYLFFLLSLAADRILPCRAWTSAIPMTSTRKSPGSLAAPGGELVRRRRRHFTMRMAPRSSSRAATTVGEVDTSSALSTFEPSPEEAVVPEKENDEEQAFSLQQKAINAAVLALSFGYVGYTVFNIDAGLTRGWSASEIAMRIPLDNWGNYESSLANQPIVTKTLINVIIYLLGDWLSQTAFAGKNVLEFDLSRTLRNGFIGACFGPLVHEYYQFSDAILPPEDGLIVRLQKILMDQTVYLTVKCSMYICAVGLLGGDDWPTVKQRVQDRIGGVVVTAWKFWPLVHCITYGLIPARHRVLWVNSVDLVWNAILASMSQKQKSTEDDPVASAALELSLEDSADLQVAEETVQFVKHELSEQEQAVLEATIVTPTQSSLDASNKNMTGEAIPVV